MGVSFLEGALFWWMLYRDANTSTTPCVGLLFDKLHIRLVRDMAVGQNQWYHFGVGAPPMLVGMLAVIGMFTGGTGF